jgi:hypothetical protein
VVGKGAMFFANGGGEDNCRHEGYYPSFNTRECIEDQDQE